MEEITLKHLWRLLKKKFFILVAAGIIGAVIAAAFTTVVMDKKYETEVRFYINVIDSDSLSQNVYYSQIYAQNIVNTYIQLLSTNTFRNRISEDIALDYSSNELKNIISFSIMNSTEIFKARVVTTSPNDCKTIADSVSRIVIETIGDFQDGVKLDIIDPPVQPTRPFTPNLYMNIVIGFALGLLLAAFWVIVRDRFDDTLKDDDDLASQYGVPVLALVPHSKQHRN